MIKLKEPNNTQFSEWNMNDWYINWNCPTRNPQTCYVQWNQNHCLCAIKFPVL